MGSDRRLRSGRVVLLGAVWGLSQTGLIILSAALTLLPGPNSLFRGEFLMVGLQVTILISAGIAVILGYRGIGIRNALIALIIAQFVGFFSFFLLVVWSAPELYRALSIYAIGLGVLMFIVGIAGTSAGERFRDWFSPPRTRILGWKFHRSASLASFVAAVLPFYPYESYSSPVGLWDSTLPLIPFVGAFVFVGLFSMFLGFRRKGDLNSERLGLMAVASFLVLGLSLISAGFTNAAATQVYSSCIGACQDFQIITALLASSLLTSSGVILACLFSDQKEGIAELIDNPGGPKRSSEKPEVRSIKQNYTKNTSVRKLPKPWAYLRHMF